MKKSAAVLAGLVACASVLIFTSAHPLTTKTLAKWFAPEALHRTWKTQHADVASSGPGRLRATFWKGYENTGFETTQLSITDWSEWKSLKFDVTNPYRDPFSVYVRISDRVEHPADETFTGGTFDGFVIGPGQNTVEINLDRMQSPEERPIDPRRIAYLGIFFNPLFLRDGMDLKFTEDKTFELSNLCLDSAPPREQKQPYGDFLFRETAAELRASREQVEQAVDELRNLIEQAQSHGIDTGYAEIVPFGANIVFHSRLVAFWQDRTEEQRKALDYLLKESCRASSQLREVLEGKRQPLVVPPVPPYRELDLRERYFRKDGEQKLIFGMLYNQQGPLLRWFANSQTDYGTQLIAGATRHNVERMPIWEAYQRYPETHRVDWDRADHIVRDRGSWEVVGPPVNVCLESPRSREAVAQAIASYLRAHHGPRRHLVLNLGFEYFYVCYCDHTRKLWTDWLRAKHRSIEAANRLWGTRFADFGQAPMMKPEGAATNRALWFDWCSFNLYRFLEQIRWSRDQIRRWEPSMPLTIGSPAYAFSPAFWTAIDEEELTDSDITGVVLEENYHLDTLMPEYLHALAGTKPVVDFEYHGVIHQILPSFLHGDAAITMWWWNDEKRWTPNEPINEWASSLPQSYTIPLSEVAKAMRDALDLRRLNREIVALATAPRPVALLYSRTSMLQHLPEESKETDTFPYLTMLRMVYNASQSVGAYVGLTTEKKILAGDLETRKILILPASQFVPERVVTEILKWVENGGTLVVLPDSLLADERARPTSLMRSLGLRLVRREPPKLQRGETQVTEYNLADVPRLPLRLQARGIFEGKALQLEAAGGRQIIKCDRRIVLADFPDGSPALVSPTKGKGKVYWFAAPLERVSWARFLELLALSAGIDIPLRVSNDEEQFHPELEFRSREYSGGHLAYFYNDSDRELRFRLDPKFPFSQVIDRRAEQPLARLEVILPPRETAILEFR